VVRRRIKQATAPRPVSLSPMAIEGTASVVIRAPIDEVYALAANVEAAPRWQPQFKRAEVLERDADGNQTLVRMITDGRVRDLKSEMRFTYEAPTGLRWRQVKGDLKSIDGSWTFEDRGDGTTRATYEMSIDLGRILGSVLRGPIIAILRNQLIELMPTKLKHEIEGGR
jgi:ribosome-associated toxin RatA of RatAB toxin-antitoxin module